VHINTLLQDPQRLLDYHFLVIPGGFSYGDDLGAGTLLAKNLTIHLGPQVRQFIDEGRPVLGICNGFQVLVRAGLLPGHDVTMDANETNTNNEQEHIGQVTLTGNRSGQFECRWVTLAPQVSTCVFTKGMERLLSLPVAHGEGRFVSTRSAAYLQAARQVPLTYTSTGGNCHGQIMYPANPNGSEEHIAGVCNERGNVFGLMPHPERYVSAMQHPTRRGDANGEGAGLIIFKNAYAYAKTLVEGTQEQSATQEANTSSYAASGVDIDAADEAKRLMQNAVRATQGREVLAGMGAFAGMMSAERLQKMAHPALVATTDGVGTKTLLAVQARRYDTVGYDIVNHCINDLLTQGARPLFFMDYLAMGKLDPVRAADIVRGVASACREAGCALLGGETAEMPDVYKEGAFDLAGTLVGMVEQDEAITGATIEAGDLLLGLPSSGLHTNGYSLARRVFAPYSLDTVFPELGEPLLNALLRPHRSYLHDITTLQDYLRVRGRAIKGMAHITGGGFEGNISRILPTGAQAVIETTSWPVPPLFSLLAKLGNVSQEEQYRALNMGIGMVLVLSPKAATDARAVLPNLIAIGAITQGKGVVLHF
jgi:phosphoribosylformylglycinamidine synthase I